MLDNYDIQRIENAIWILSQYQCELADITEYQCELADIAEKDKNFTRYDIYYGIYNLMKMSDAAFDTHFTH